MFRHLYRIAPLFLALLLALCAAMSAQTLRLPDPATPQDRPARIIEVKPVPSLSPGDNGHTFKTAVWFVQVKGTDALLFPVAYVNYTTKPSCGTHDHSTCGVIWCAGELYVTAQEIGFKPLVT